ncbi:histone chaperone, partial [Coemansia nantahalensis]
MSDNKAVDIKSDDKAADTAPTPQNTPIFTAPIARPAAAAPVAEVPALQNQALLSLLQGRLGSLVGAPSGYIEALPKAVRERIGVLKHLQLQRIEISKQLHLELLELEKKYTKMAEPLYARRSALIQGSAEPTAEEKAEAAKIAEAEKAAEGDEAAAADDAGAEAEAEGDAEQGIPEFWLTALRNHPQLAELITERDEDAIKKLRDIRLVYLTDERGFKLEFEFAENPYFTNALLTKTYIYEQSNVSGELEF